MAKRGGFPGGMPGNMANIMKQAQKMQKQMEEAQKNLEEQEVTAAACTRIFMFPSHGISDSICTFTVFPFTVFSTLLPIYKCTNSVSSFSVNA